MLKSHSNIIFHPQKVHNFAKLEMCGSKIGTALPIAILNKEWQQINQFCS